MKIIQDSLDYYDKHRDTYKKYIDKFYYYKKNISMNDNEKSTITFFDKNDNKVLEANIDMIGSLNTYTNLWTWSWANIKSPKNLNYLSRKMLNYGLDIMGKDKVHLYLKQLLISSDINVVNDLQLEIILAISSFIIQNPHIIKTREGEDVMYIINYYSISDIKTFN